MARRGLDELQDPALSALIAELEEDPGSVGLILHGSRASGTHRPDSDYDLIWVIGDEAYERRKQTEALLERRELPGVLTADILYQSPSRLAWLAENPGWWTATYLAARVVFDKTGEVARSLAAIADRAGERAYTQIDEAYDGYLNSFVRSLKAWRAENELGGRLHAAESAFQLLKTLCYLESRWPPYHDALSGELAALEEAQGWEAGFLERALVRLLESGDPTFQQELERRVERLMDSRGVRHEWGDDLEPLKQLRFDS